MVAQKECLRRAVEGSRCWRRERMNQILPQGAKEGVQGCGGVDSGQKMNRSRRAVDQAEAFKVKNSFYKLSPILVLQFHSMI